MRNNEPSTRQMLRTTIGSKQSLRVPPRSKTPTAYGHGNSLVENAIGRVRALAENLVHNLERPSFGLGLRATRHATWLLNPVDPIRGATGCELFHNKVYKGKLCEFGEPVVFGYFRGPHKRRCQMARHGLFGEIGVSRQLYHGEGLAFSRGETSWHKLEDSLVVFLEFQLLLW